MINFEKILKYNSNKLNSSDFDGKLDDGRFVEFKLNVPTNLDNIIRKAVAMANTCGGVIIFGFDERKKSIVGLTGDVKGLVQKIDSRMKSLSIGIQYSITTESVRDNERHIIILEIQKSESTSYFSRIETSPARQTAYTFKKSPKGEFAPESTTSMRYVKVYKYMTLDAFLTSLYCKTWRFFEPSKWNDQFEQRFYCAKYLLSAAKGNTPQLFATCVTRAMNNEAAWKVYANGQGLGAHCLQFELDIAELRKQLRASGHRLEERPIEYKRDLEILELHKKHSKSYAKYFGSFTFNSFLSLLSLKREAYTYEQEVRLFIIPKVGGSRNKNRKAKSLDINIDWPKVINRVRIDKKCTDAELAALQQACFFVGINPIIKNYSFIGNNPIPPGMKDVEFEKFDIDDMPGARSITIK